LNILITFRIFEQFALALKKRVCPEFTVLNMYFLSFRIFEQLCACPEKQSCPEIFHCIEVFFIIQDFWEICAYPENRVCTENFYVGGPAVLSTPRLVRLCLELKIGSLESEKIIIGSLQVHTGYPTFSFKKTC